MHTTRQVQIMKTRYKLHFADPKNLDLEEFKSNLAWVLKHVRLLGNTHAVGMKKGRDLLTLLMENPLHTVILEGEETSRSSINNATEQLAAHGIVAEPDGPLATIKGAAFDAMELGQHELCKDILEVLLKHGGE